MFKSVFSLLSFAAFAVAQAASLSDETLSDDTESESPPSSRPTTVPASRPTVTASTIVSSVMNTTRCIVGIVWASLFLILLLVVVIKLCTRNRALPRGPYLLLAVGTFFLVVSGGLSAALYRTTFNLSAVGVVALSSVGSFLSGFGETFLLASIVWIIQQRRNVLTVMKSYIDQPTASQSAKRGLDWTLVFAVFALGIIWRSMSLDMIMFTSNQSNLRDYNVVMGLTVRLQRTAIFSHVLIAAVAILLLDIIISSILLVRSGKDQQYNDTAARRLLYVAVPFCALYLTSRVAFDIYNTVQTNKDANVKYTSGLIEMIVNGTCQFFLILGCILTMTSSDVDDHSSQYGVDSTDGLVQNTQVGNALSYPHYIQRSQRLQQNQSYQPQTVQYRYP